MNGREVIAEAMSRSVKLLDEGSWGPGTRFGAWQHRGAGRAAGSQPGLGSCLVQVRGGDFVFHHSCRLEVVCLDAKLMEVTVANEGFVRSYQSTQARLSAGTTYRLRSGVVMPSGGQELRLADLVVEAAARLGEATRADILAATGVDSRAAGRAFAVLVRERVLLRSTAALPVHEGAKRRLESRGETVVQGTVYRVGGTHPLKRHIYLDLGGGERAKVFCYGGEAKIAARLLPGSTVSAVGRILRTGPVLHVRANRIEGCEETSA